MDLPALAGSVAEAREQRRDTHSAELVTIHGGLVPVTIQVFRTGKQQERGFPGYPNDFIVRAPDWHLWPDGEDVATWAALLDIAMCMAQDSESGCLPLLVQTIWDGGDPDEFVEAHALGTDWLTLGRLLQLMAHQEDANYGKYSGRWLARYFIDCRLAGAPEDLVQRIASSRSKPQGAAAPEACAECVRRTGIQCGRLLAPGTTFVASETRAIYRPNSK